MLSCSLHGAFTGNHAVAAEVYALLRRLRGVFMEAYPLHWGFHGAFIVMSWGFHNTVTEISACRFMGLSWHCHGGMCAFKGRLRCMRIHDVFKVLSWGFQGGGVYAFNVVSWWFHGSFVGVLYGISWGRSWFLDGAAILSWCCRGSVRTSTWGFRDAFKEL